MPIPPTRNTLLPMLPCDCYLCQNSELNWSAAQIVSAEVDAVQTEGNNPVAVRDTEEQAKDNSLSLSLSTSFSICNFTFIFTYKYNSRSFLIAPAYPPIYNFYIMNVCCAPPINIFQKPFHTASLLFGATPCQTFYKSSKNRLTTPAAILCKKVSQNLFFFTF